MACRMTADSVTKALGITRCEGSQALGVEVYQSHHGVAEGAGHQRPHHLGGGDVSSSAHDADTTKQTYT
jgi:hypothetical protein